MRRWLYILVSFVVVTICVTTTALAWDCHRINRAGLSVETCQGSDDRALSVLMSLLATLLALRIDPKREDDDNPSSILNQWPRSSANDLSE